MRGDEAFHASTPIPVPGGGTPGYHDLKHSQQLIGYLQVSRVTCVMEGHQHLVRQTARVTRETWRISRRFRHDADQCADFFTAVDYVGRRGGQWDIPVNSGSP